MIIKLVPIGSPESLSIARNGESLTINGKIFDFAAVSEGATLPGQAVASPWLLGPVERIGGSLTLTLILPHADDAPQSVRFPSDIVSPPDGQILLPGQNSEVLGQEAPGVVDWSQLVTAEMKAETAAAQLLMAAVTETGRLRKIADDAIAPLQDAVELGRADQAKQDQLKAWKNYRLDLVEVPEQDGYPAIIDWPAPPA